MILEGNVFRLCVVPKVHALCGVTCGGTGEPIGSASYGGGAPIGSALGLLVQGGSSVWYAMAEAEP